MVRGQREKIQNGRKGERGLKMKRQSHYHEWGHSRGEAPRVRAVKSSEFGDGKL